MIVLLQIVLEGMGYRVLASRNSKAALRQLSFLEFDLLITDVHMGEVSGFDLLARMRAARADIPVVVMSADPDPEIPANALRLGAVAFLAKPFGRREIAEAIDAGLHPR